MIGKTPYRNRLSHARAQAEIAGRVTTLILMRDETGEVDMVAACKKLGTSSRTIQRYMSAISRAGLKIRATKQGIVRSIEQARPTSGTSGPAILGPAIVAARLAEPRTDPTLCVCGAAQGRHGTRNGIQFAGRCDLTGCPEYMAKGE